MSTSMNNGDRRRFVILSDGQPAPGTGLPMTVFNTFEGSEDVPELIAYGWSRHQPEGPLLTTMLDEAYGLDFHSEEPSFLWRLARLARLNQATVSPQPRDLAVRLVALDAPAALIFGPGSDMLFYADRTLLLAPHIDATIYIVDDLRIPLASSRNPVYRWYGSFVARRLLRRCSKRYVITEEMAGEYREAFGLDFEVLGLPIPDAEYRDALLRAPQAPPASAPALNVFLWRARWGRSTPIAFGRWRRPSSI